MSAKAWLVRVTIGAAVLAVAGCAAVRTGNPARGEAVVAQWCSQCHAIRGTQADPKHPPTFEQVAARNGRDAPYLRQFLNEDHFPMTTYRLLEKEKDDVVAMIVSLRP